MIILFIFFQPVQGADPLTHVFESAVPNHLSIERLPEPKINLFTGSASYLYSVEVPRGTNDLQPQINFIYDSHQTNSPPSVSDSGNFEVGGYTSRGSGAYYGEKVSGGLQLSLDPSAQKIEDVGGTSIEGGVSGVLGLGGGISLGYDESELFSGNLEPNSITAEISFGEGGGASIMKTETKVSSPWFSDNVETNNVLKTLFGSSHTEESLFEDTICSWCLNQEDYYNFVKRKMGINKKQIEEE